MDSFVQDIRYGVRSLLRTPVFTLVAGLTLALGIGGTAALYTVLHQAVLARLPVARPAELVQVVTDRGPDGVSYNLSLNRFAALRESPALSGVLAHSSLAFAVGHERGAERVDGGVISRGFFGVLGVPLALGREFSADEDRSGGPAAVVLSHDLWRTRFGGRTDVLGRAVTLNGQPFTIVGVAAQGFRGLVAGRTEAVWIPIPAIVRVSDASFEIDNPGVSWLDVFARLAPGVSRAQAQAELARRDAAEVREGRRPAVDHTHLLDGSRGLADTVDWLTRPVMLLFGVAGLVLLLACANIANLLLARAGARRREVAVRLALGARRWRLVRQMLTESVLLASLGGVAGLLVAMWGAEFLLRYRAADSGPLDIAVGVDLAVLAFAAAVSLLTGLAFGLAPALRASRADVTPALRGAETAPRDRLFGLRGALVVVQVAISLVLVTGAALFLRTLQQLARVDIGFTTGPVLLASVNLEQAGYDRERGWRLQADLLERLAAVPGVAAVSAANVITPTPGGSSWGGMRIEGYTPGPDEVTSFDVNRVGPDYFAALGAQLLRGRSFTGRDAAGAPPVMIVNEAFARRYFAGADPVGRHVYLGAPPRERAVAIVGLARDGKYREMREGELPNAYFPLLQFYQPEITFIVRARGGDPLALAAAVRAEIQARDPALPVFGIGTLAEHVARATAQERMIATLSAGFGALALLLVGLGLFGVIAFGVAQRAREIGVRIALGARPAAVVGMVMKNGAKLVAAGLAIGLAGSLALGGTAARFLYGVTAADPRVLAAAVVILASVALLASYLPARRAARVDPMAALRNE